MIPIIVIQARIMITAPIKYKKEIMFTPPVFPHELNDIFRIQGEGVPCQQEKCSRWSLNSKPPSLVVLRRIYLPPVLQKSPKISYNRGHRSCAIYF